MIFFCLTFSVLTVNGQGIFHYPGMFFAPIRQPGAYSLAKSSSGLLAPGAFHLDMEVGSSFSTMPAGGSMFSQYVLPHLTYRASPRLLLEGGAMISYDYLGQHNRFMPATGFSGGTSTLVYASGTYLLHPRLTLSGTVYKNYFQANNRLTPGNETWNQPNAYDFQGMFMQLDYKLSNSIHFGASFHYKNQPWSVVPGQNDFFSNPNIPWH